MKKAIIFSIILILAILYSKSKFHKKSQSFSLKQEGLLKSIETIRVYLIYFHKKFKTLFLDWVMLKLKTVSGP
jgi:hypothetical protein